MNIALTFYCPFCNHYMQLDDEAIERFSLHPTAPFQKKTNSKPYLKDGMA